MREIKFLSGSLPWKLPCLLTPLKIMHVDLCLPRQARVWQRRSSCVRLSEPFIVRTKCQLKIIINIIKIIIIIIAIIIIIIIVIKNLEGSWVVREWWSKNSPTRVFT